jgi:hypothetical protein
MFKKATIFVKLDPAIPSIAYDTYWRFAFERQNVFLERFNGESENLTLDPIIKQYKFTNAYRACDRVSQYLIGNVIYNGNKYTPRDLILRILLFKLFNKIETWQLIEHRFGHIDSNNFPLTKIKNFLDTEMNNGRVLYSNAYMMASGCTEFQVTRKHHAHLMLINKMLKDNLAEKLQSCKRMSDAYLLLLAYPLIGKFLAYQYVTDLNYSELTNFSEIEFTVPGPGARDGIRKCFTSLGGLTETDVIKLMTDRQELEFERLGLDFKTLGGRLLQHIDIQNIFCETDKYSRIAHPEIMGISGRTKIKQLFKPNHKKIDYVFPPKWQINLGVK